jgi:hypothetical protein
LKKSLLDTDIFSDVTKWVNPTVAGHATGYRKAFTRYTISAVTFMEVIRGYQKWGTEGHALAWRKNG